MHLEDVVNSLSTSANATLLHDETNNEGDSHMPLSEDDDDILEDMGLSKQIANFEVVVNQLNAKIMQLAPQPHLQQLY